MSENLKNKAVIGVSWNILGNTLLFSINFFVGITLARILSPGDFGLLGILFVIFELAMIFINSGLSAAYIQKKEISTDDTNTIFTTNLGMTIILYSLLFVFSPIIADFYEQPKLTILIRIMGLVLFINAFNLIQTSQIIRNLEFKKNTKTMIVATFFSGIAAVTSALYGLGVWSLVIQYLTQRLIITVGLLFLIRWKPSFLFSTSSFKYMFSFGFWLLVSQLINTLFKNIYTLAIGKLFSVYQLGFYTKANELNTIASSQISGAVDVVTFPILSKLQNEPDKLKSAMSTFLQYNLFLSLPLLATLMVVAKPFVIIILTEKWIPMIPFLQLFCVIGMLHPLQNINLQVLRAIGKTKLDFKIVLFQNILRVTNLYVMYPYGIIYIILGEVIITLISLGYNTRFTRLYVNYSLIKQLNDTKLIFLGGIIAVAGAYSISILFESLWLELIIGGVSTFIIYLAIQYIFNKSLLKDIFSLKSILINKSTM